MICAAVPFGFWQEPADNTGPGWVLVDTDEPSGASVSTFSFSGVDGVKAVYDLDMSADGAAVTPEVEIDEVWYPIDVAHKNISGSNSSSYVGSTGFGLGPTGNASGENTSATVTVLGCNSTTRYPVIIVTGGYSSTSGNVRMMQGAMGRKTTGVITGLRFAPSSGSFSGKVAYLTYTRP